jgi:hypothetical protein
MAQRESSEESERVTQNLLQCGELTELCLELRLAVLRQECPEDEARRRLWRDILQAKERAWQRNPS